MRKIIIAVVAAAVALLGTSAAVAVEETDANPGPVSLAGGLNAGERVQVASLDLGDGDWTVTAKATLFVGDPSDGKPAGDQKNSQGCGVYADGVQVAGAGGSSGLWASVEGGKQVTLGDAEHPFRLPPEWTEDPIVVAGPVSVTLVCFIDASHSGVTEGDRANYEALDISLVAAQPDPEPVDDPTDEPTEEPTEPVDEPTDEPTEPAPVIPTAVPAGSGTLPDTGPAELLGMTAAGLALLGVGGLILRRRATSADRVGL